MRSTLDDAVAGPTRGLSSALTYNNRGGFGRTAEPSAPPAARPYGRRAIDSPANRAAIFANTSSVPAAWILPEENSGGPVLEIVSQVRDKLLAVPAAQMRSIVEVCHEVESERSKGITLGPRHGWGLDTPCSVFTLAAIDALSKRTDYTPASKKVIVDSLEVVPAFAKVVSARGWEDETVQAVSKGMLRRIDQGSGWSGSLSYWVSIFERQNTEKSHELLMYLLTETKGAAMAACFGHWKGDRLGNLTRTEVLSRAWKTAQRQRKTDCWLFARLAAENGHTDALMIMAKIVLTKNNEDDEIFYAFQTKTSDELVALFDANVATGYEAAAAVIQNRAALAFDSEAKKYRIKRD